MRGRRALGVNGRLVPYETTAPGQSVCFGDSAFAHCDPPAQVGNDADFGPGDGSDLQAQHDPAVRTRVNLGPISPCVLLARRVHRPHGGPVRRCVLGFGPPRRAAFMNGCRTTWSENVAELDFVTAIAPRQSIRSRPALGRRRSQRSVDPATSGGPRRQSGRRRVHDDGLPSATAGYLSATSPQESAPPPRQSGLPARRPPEVELRSVHIGCGSSSRHRSSHVGNGHCDRGPRFR